MSVFADTNVLVYSRDEADPAKHDAAKAWIEALWHSGTGTLSQQVLSEYYVTVTRMLVPAMAREAARREVIDLATWTMAPTTPETIAAAWHVEDRFGLSFWDALIVASADAAGCTTLLTEDLQHGQRFGDVTVVSPFEVAPSELIT